MSIKITLPDNSIKEFDAGVSTLDVAKSIANSLAKKAVAGKYNGQLIGLNDALSADGSLEIITKDSDEG